MTTTNFDNLSLHQAEVALSVSCGASLTSAAKTAGVGRSTVYSWLAKDSNFTIAVQNAKVAYIASLRDQLREASIKALNTVTEIMTDPTAPAGVRLKAALAVLNRPHFPDGWHLPEEVETPTSQNILDRIQSLETSERLALKASQSKTNLDETEHKSDPVQQEPTDTVLDTSEQENEPEPPQNHPEPIRVDKIGRNEQCPCGSGKKFKRCCLNKPIAAAA